MRIKNIKYVIMLMGLFAASAAAAQGHMNIEQKWLGRSLFNPAATGNTNTLDIYGIAREQWIGVKGAPSTQLFYGHYLLQNMNSGIGFGVINESVGFYHMVDIKAAYAYHIFLSDDLTLSIGLSPMITWTFRNDAEISFDYPDIAVVQPFDSRVDPNFDVGVELRNQWLKFGISALRLIERKENVVSFRSFMVYGMGRFRLTNDIDFGPVLAGTLYRSAINGEAGMMAYYKKQTSQRLSRLTAPETYDFLWGGLYFRTAGELSVTAGIGITEQWRLGYAYSYSFQYRSEYNPSTHEILLSWRIPVSTGTRRYYRCEDC